MKSVVPAVACVHPRRSAIIAADRFRWCVAHASEERMQRNLDTRREMPDHLVSIEGNDLASAVGKVVGEKTAPRPKAIACEWCIEVDLHNLYFEDITGLGFCNRNRTRENMSTWSSVLHLLIDRFIVRGDIGCDHAFAFEPFA
jgi:hypothetical protein